MNTTAVFVEILIVGIEAATWIILFVLTFFGTGALRNDLFAGWQALASFVFLSFVYVLGIVIDRVADTLYKWFREETDLGRWVQHRLGSRTERKPEKVSVMRLALMERDDGRARFLDYQRSRLRIARASMFNLVLVLPASVAFAFKRTDLGWPRSIGIAIPVLLFIVVTLFAAERIGDAYINRLIEAYRMLSPGGDSGKSAAGAGQRRISEEPDECLRAAAICYRIQTSPEFYLITTKDKGKWVFPKGHLKQGEEPWEAAAREAKEEAGITGSVDTTTLTSYKYPSGGAPCDELQVLAYLLKVDHVGRPRKSERDRIGGWCTPDDAKGRLDPTHQRVIEEALARLSPGTHS